MKVYKKCACCGKIMFLLLGSDFGNEVEFGSAFGSKDNIPHLNANHEKDWNSLTEFLNNLKNSHGEVFISLKAKEKDSFPKEILKWTENYKEKEENRREEKQRDTEPPQEKDWKNIHRDFAQQEVKQSWISAGFTYEQTKAWVDIGIKPTDARFCWWLREFKEKDPLWVLNYGNMVELRKEYENTTILDG